MCIKHEESQNPKVAEIHRNQAFQGSQPRAFTLELKINSVTGNHLLCCCLSWAGTEEQEAAQPMAGELPGAAGGAPALSRALGQAVGQEGLHCSPFVLGQMGKGQSWGWNSQGQSWGTAELPCTPAMCAQRPQAP